MSDVEFGEFVATNLPNLLHFGHLLTGDPSSAEDLVQAALLKVLKAWPRLVTDVDFRPDAYVRRVMTNTWLTWWRQWTYRVQVGDVPDRGTSQANTGEGADMARALATLPLRAADGACAPLLLRFAGS